MGINYRCTKSDCRKRVTLAKPYERYFSPPKCPGCGRTYTLYNCNKAEKDRTIRRTCHCDGIFWPHRKGTVIDENQYCKEIPLEEVEDILFNKELGTTSIAMKPEDDCPF